MTSSVYIVGAKRTCIGNFNGSLASVPVHELGAAAIHGALEHAHIHAHAVDSVVFGHVLTAGCGQNPARQAAVAAEIPIESPAYGVSMLCGSGLKAIGLAYQTIRCGDAAIMVAGGQENMSMSPHYMHLRSARRFGNASMVDTLQHDGLTDAFNHYPMGETAENMAALFDISRERQDEYALQSQLKAAAAQRAGRLAAEIVPVSVKDRTGVKLVDQDEFIKPATTLDGLAKLSTVFKADEGTVTAGNASGLNDGAAAVVLMSETALKAHNLTPLARIVSYAEAGVDPALMGTGPIPAAKAALLKAGWRIEDLDLIESNEAFAAQSCAVTQSLNIDETKLNVNGGAIALGHPLGASGARIVVTLVHEMQRRQAKKGLAMICIGGGMGIALCVELP